MEIKHKDNKKEGTFIARKDGVDCGEMTYFWSNDDTFVINHTYVEPAFEGKGVGKELFNAAVSFARNSNSKIVPVCSFVRAMFARNESIGDVLAKLK